MTLLLILRGLFRSGSLGSALQAGGWVSFFVVLLLGWSWVWPVAPTQNRQTGCSAALGAFVLTLLLAYHVCFLSSIPDASEAVDHLVGPSCLSQTTGTGLSR